MKKFVELAKGSNKVTEASTNSMEVVEDNATPLEVVKASVELVEASTSFHGSSVSFLKLHSGSFQKLPRKS